MEVEAGKLVNTHTGDILSSALVKEILQLVLVSH